MNEINFLNAISEKKQIAFYTWLKISTFFILITFLIIIFLYARKIMIINEIEKQKFILEKSVSKFDETINEKTKTSKFLQDLKASHEFLIQKINKSDNNLAFNILHIITQALPNNLFLEKIEYNSKVGILIKGYSYLPEDVIQFVQNLNNIPSISRVKLEYLRSKDIDNLENTILHEFHISLRLQKNSKKTSKIWQAK